MRATSSIAQSSLARAAAAQAFPSCLEDLKQQAKPSMVPDRNDARGRAVEESLPPHSKGNPRISIFGSVDYYHSDSPALCDAIGAAIGNSCPHAVILTGANAITQECLARAFHKKVGSTARVFHLAPEGYVCNWDFGTCVEAGRDAEERRHILARSSDICISVEGGPGTSDEMGIAIRAGKVLIPLGRTGGASNGMFDAPDIPRPSFVDEETWALLQDEDGTVEDTAMAVVSIVQAASKQTKQRPATSASQLEAINRTIVESMDMTYTKRPCLPQGCPEYVEPTLAGFAHRVFHGKEHASDNAGCNLGDIYLGPQTAAKRSPFYENELKAKKIEGIVNCTNTFPCYFHGTILYCTVAVNDECGADILVYLDGATTFLHSLISKGKNVLVHCRMGVSRSSTVVIAYLIRFWGMNRDEAFLHVKKRRPIASPNGGFWQQLQKFERRCNGSTGEDATRAERVELDLEWAKQSNALYATCHESPDVLRESVLTRRLLEVADTETQTRERILTVCLDYLWGRGVIDIDSEWLQFVCGTMDERKGEARRSSVIVRETLPERQGLRFLEYLGRRSL